MKDKTKKDFRLYILLRTDLQSMGPGRAAAQASHASNAFIHDFGPGSKCERGDVKEWQRQTKQGFGTAIVLGVTKKQIDDFWSCKGLKRYITKGLVVDPDYVIRVNHEIAELLRQNYDGRFCNFKFNYFMADDSSVAISRKEVTCAYIFGEKEELEPFLGALPLYG
jgi:hypothetical protein